MSASVRRPPLILAGATGLLVGLLAGCGSDSTAADRSPAGSSMDPGRSATSSATPTGTPTGAPTTSPAQDTTAVAVYLVGETPLGPRLFREFRQVPVADPLAEAAALSVAGDRLDPDYRTLYPTPSVIAGVTFSEEAGAFVVQLADDSWAEQPPAMSRSQARLALQQLVYTLQGVEQTRAPVLFQVGADPATVFGIDTTGGVQARDQADTLSLVSISDPAEGVSVHGSFTASGVSNSFEATTPWEIRAGEEVVATGFATADGWMDRLYPWQTDVDVSGLTPGDYTFVVMTDDPSDGEGPPPTEDTRTITVR